MIFSHTRNTRCITENNYRYIRSDVPAEVSEHEIRFLKMQSAENLKEMLCQFAKANPEINPEVITPHESYMQQFLSQMQNQKQTACIFQSTML